MGIVPPNVPQRLPLMPILILGLSAALLVLAVSASLAAAIDPLGPLLVLALGLAGGRTLLRSGAERRVLYVGIAFVALLTVPHGLLTHGTLTDLGPYPATNLSDASDALAARTPVDSVAHDHGHLVSFAATETKPPALAYRIGGETQWASALPSDRQIASLREMHVFPLLWRTRVDAWADGPDAPAWLYVWRWGGVQELYVMDETD